MPEASDASEATGNEGQSDLVSVEEASDKDIEAFLSLSDDEREDFVNSLEPGEKPTTDKPPAQTAPLKTEASEQKPAPQQQVPEGFVSREEHERLKSQVKQQEQFIARRGTELGETRKERNALKTQLEEAKRKLSEGIQEAWDESPQEAYQRSKKIEQIDQSLGALKHEEQQEQHETIAKDFVGRYVAQEEFDLDAISEMLVEDMGVKPEFVKQFRQNPFTSASPAELVHMAKHAHLRKLIMKIVPATQRLLQEVETLKKKGNAAPERTLDKLQRELKKPPQINAGSSSSPNETVTTSADVSQLTDAQLDELLKKANRA